jgi:hypothetical protein
MSEILQQEREANATYAGECLNIDGKLGVCFLEQDAKAVPSWDWEQVLAEVAKGTNQ